MMAITNRKQNPNPIAKFLVVGLLGFTVLHPLHPLFGWGIVLFFSLMYILNGLVKDGIQNALIYGILFLIPNFTIIAKSLIVIKMFFGLLLAVRMFYFAFAAGAFLIKTADVGSILASMDCLHIPKAISIPTAVIFRFFPSFEEERRNIKMAMKIRGIKITNPIKYLEYITVPLLIISSTIADDISKAAETKCIGNPIRKTRYVDITIKGMDFVYTGVLVLLTVGGWICCH